MPKRMVLLVSLFALGLCACGGEDVSDEGGVAGTYVMDGEALLAAAKAWLMQSPVPPGMTAEEHERRIDEGIANQPERSAELVLKPDGSFEDTWTIGGEVMRSTGTWSLEDRTLTLTTTHGQGKERSEPVEVECEDGVITLRDKVEYPVVFRRQ